jgi:hypothetical protein
MKEKYAQQLRAAVTGATVDTDFDLVVHPFFFSVLSLRLCVSVVKLFLTCITTEAQRRRGYTEG